VFVLADVKSLIPHLAKLASPSSISPHMICLL